MSTFLEKNKKKSALAALLLFLRTRKTATALLLVAALVSFLFAGPSNLLLRVPGGVRMAAGAAWLAGKAGVDISKWGLSSGKRGYGDLLAAFREAKDGSGKAGWTAFMGAPGAVGVGSVDFVKGDRKDLEAASGSGAKLPKPGSVEGVLNPDDARDRGEGEGVALLESDVSGEREGLVKNAFAGGFAAKSGDGGGAEEALSGGAFASAGFFSGGRGATSGKLGDVLKGGLEGIAAAPGKGVAIAGGAKGRLSASKAAAMRVRTTKGLLGAHTIGGQRAIVQLVAGRARASVAVAPGGDCPGECAATETGRIYIGKVAGAGVLKTDMESAPALSADAHIPSVADPAKLIECMDTVMKCQQGKTDDIERSGKLSTQIEGLAARMLGACGDPCHCGTCNSLKGQIKSLCSDLQVTGDAVDKQCDRPPFCAAIDAATPSSSSSDKGKNLCAMDMGKCGCNDLWCDTKCVAKKIEKWF